jgi:hypothetical protein
MALVLINSGPRMAALIATPEGAIEPSQWPHLTDEQLRRAASTAFRRPGYTTDATDAVPTDRAPR